MPGDPLAVRHPLLVRAAQLLLTLAACVVLFLAAGRFDWPGAWLYLGSNALMWIIGGVVATWRNPEVIAARAQSHSGTKGFDKFFGVAYTCCWLAILVIAGLDAVRWGWAPPPAAAMFTGVVLQLAGGIPIGWAMAVNPHLERTVRIQTEREHEVISNGPYRVVRHPMYVGMLMQLAAAPLVLRSAWAFAPAAASAAALIWRTAREDRTLRQELPGYEEFTTRTHYRLLPGVW